MKKSVGILVIVLSTVFSVSAQSTEFTYQGSLKDGATAANGNYDFEFALFDAVSGGTQLGSTLTLNTVAVASGIFSVKLDFGSQFPGANRFLEIRLRLTGQPGITTLAPRQLVTSAPYSVKSLNTDNAAQLGGVAASQYVLTDDPRMSDARNPLPNSTNYIQNQNAVPQASGNFNITGDGTAGGTLSGNVVNAATKYNIGGSRVLSNPGDDNLFAGTNAGQSNTTGFENSFFGRNAGQSNTTGFSNSFVGLNAGFANTTGNDNSFFGSEAGSANKGSDNSFFGRSAGLSNTTGSDNSFFGMSAGLSNTTGADNSFFGRSAGFRNTTGISNSFFGLFAGYSNTMGNDNSFFGNFAGQANTTGSSNSFFGGNAGDTNTTGIQNAFFGSQAGTSNTTGGSDVFIGTQAGSANTDGTFNVFVGTFAGNLNTTGDNNTTIGYNADVASDNLNFATAIGAQSVASLSNSIYLGRADGSDAVRIPGSVVINGTLVVTTLGSAGATSICLNAASRISPCSSSLRYKTNIGQFSAGLSFINLLRPITFDWKDGGMKDIGFGAEDIAKIDPRFVTYNSAGEVEGVKYDRISAVLVNAVKEQQAQIEEQKETINRQQTQIDDLKQIVCSLKPDAKGCSAK